MAALSIQIDPVCNRSIILTLILLLLWNNNIFGQNGSETQLWANYNARYYMPKLKSWGDARFGIRHALSENASTTYLLRIKAIINIGSYLELHPGIDFRKTFNKKFSNEFEIRTWQGLMLHWPSFGRFLFDHFYRFEQRFHYLDGQPKEEIGLRSRYRIRSIIPINSSLITDNTFFTRIQAELFFPHDNEISELFASTIRYGVTLGYNLNSRWRFYASYFIDNVKQNGYGGRELNNHILSIYIRNRF